MNEEGAYTEHINFIVKEAGIDESTIKKVLEADEKYMDIVITELMGNEEA